MSNQGIKFQKELDSMKKEIKGLKQMLQVFLSQGQVPNQQVAPVGNQQQQVAPAQPDDDWDKLIKLVTLKHGFTLEREKIQSGKEFFSDMRKSLLAD